MLRQWGVKAHSDVMESKFNKMVDEPIVTSSINALAKSQSSRSLKVSGPPGSIGRPRVIEVAVDVEREESNESESDENSFESTSSEDEDEGLSTVYEAEEEEPATAADASSNFQYYSIDDVELDDVASEYTPGGRNIGTSSPSSTIDGRDVLTPVVSCDDTEEDVETEAGNVTPIPEENTTHARQASDEITGNLVRQKGIRSRLRSEKRADEESKQTKQPRSSNSFREFFRGTFRRMPDDGMSKSNEELHEVTEVANAHELLNHSHRSVSQSSLTPTGTPRPSHFVVVAVDFGTTYSGYAFSFVHRPDTIHMMRRWAGGDPGINNQKTPTTILLTPQGAFHSFGFEARDYYHDLELNDARNWFYFERFKMALHSNLNLSKTTQLIAANGKQMPALQVFSHALRFFKKHALQELSDELGTHMKTCDVRWVVTVPAIWRPQAKQFMREAAYQAGLAAESNPSQLVIALEPEAASIYCRKLRHTQLQNSQNDVALPYPTLKSGCQYMVVDCGGGTVDVTVHQIVGSRTLQEVRAASGGAMGSVAVDAEFERLLRNIFGDDFIDTFRRKRPAGAVDLFVAWESRKRSVNLTKQQSVNISLPFSFIDLHKKIRGFAVEVAVKKYNDENVRWSAQGMLRLTPELIKKLFQPTLDAIVSHVVTQIDRKISHLFLVGGFAESPLLQQQLRDAVGSKVRVIIPNDVSLTILKGAVLFGLDPTTVQMRTSQMTYGVGILNKFNSSIHPSNKRLVRGNGLWCTDVFDAYVCAGHLVGLGDVVQRSYAPVRGNQSTVVINLYACERADVKFIDEHGVRKCATLRINLPSTTSNNKASNSSKRELQISMMFGDTEIKVHCLDVITGTKVRATVDFLSR